jgi:hypothetical protein
LYDTGLVLSMNCTITNDPIAILRYMTKYIWGL